MSKFDPNQEAKYQKLIKEANAGRDALMELYRLIPDRLEYALSKSGSIGVWSVYKNPVANLQYRIKSIVPEPFEIRGEFDNSGYRYEVKITPDLKYIRIGCLDFPTLEFLEGLFTLTHYISESFELPHSQGSLISSRRGIKFKDYWISWSNADKLYDIFKFAKLSRVKKVQTIEQTRAWANKVKEANDNDPWDED